MSRSGDPNHRLTAYRHGWCDGAACRFYVAPAEHADDYDYGYAAGREAFRDAMEERRAELGLPPSARILPMGG